MSDSSLSTEYAGLSLKNPVLVSAGPWSHDSARILKGLEAGAAAVVTTSIVSEACSVHSPRLYYSQSQLANIKLYSELSLEDWKRNIGEVKDAGGTVIASIMGETPSEIAYLAEIVERFGADAIEIGAAAPLGEGIEIKCADPDFVYSYTEMATKTVHIPVTIKLSATVTNPVACAKAAEAGGAAGISGIDAVRSLIGIDIETQKPLLASIGGLSGPSIKPVSLAVASMVSDAVKIPVCGIGGIEDYSDVLEYIMAGVSAAQVGSSILTRGFVNISVIIDELSRWLDSKGYSSVNDIRGAAVSNLSSLRDLRTDPLAAELKADCSKAGCRKCETSCMYDAVSFTDGKISISADACSGCGICAGICPDSLIELKWYEPK